MLEMWLTDKLSDYLITSKLGEYKIDDLLGLYDQDLTMFIETLSRRKYVYFSWDMYFECFPMSEC